MPIQLTGLGGFDSGNVISQLVQIAQKPLQEIDRRKAQIDSASSTLTAFSSKLSTLKNAATSLSSSSGFTSMAATSSDAGLVPSVTGLALQSSYTIDVTQLAKAQKSRSGSQVSASTALGQTGDLTLQVGSGSAVTVSVAATDKLTDIASKINQAGLRVSASVVNAGGSFRLIVQGLDTGAANAVSLTESNGLALGLGTPASTYEPAQDAVLTVDGLPVTRPTNSVADAVPGVTLALTKTTSAPATVRISADSGALKTKISAFIAAYNDIVQTGQNAAGYGSIKAQNPVLAADRGIRRALDRISSITSAPVAGTSGEFSTLASIGITRTRDGILSLDGAKFDAALTKDADAVRKIFVTDTTLGATGVMKTLSDGIDALITDTAGPVKSRIDGLVKQSKALVDSRLKKAERVDAYEQQLRRQFAKLDQAMSKYNAMSGALAGLSKTNTSG
jgi:flagellar hook-associated protein 2